MTHVITKKFTAGIVTLTESNDGNITLKNLLGVGEVLPVDQMLGDVAYSLSFEFNAVITYGYGDLGGYVLKNPTLPLSQHISQTKLCNGFRCVSDEITDNELGEVVMTITSADLCGLWDESQHTSDGAYIAFSDTIVKLLTMVSYDWLTLDYIGEFKILIHAEPLD